MSEWYACARFPLDSNLATVHQVLTDRGIIHRFTEEKGMQFLWLLHQADQPVVEQLLSSWQRNDLQHETSDLSSNLAAQNRQSFDQALLNFLAAPASALIVVLGVLGALLVSYDAKHEFYWVSKFSFFPFEVIGGLQFFDSAQQALRDGQIWRLLTPTFLHFGALHIVFNGLWIWIFGQQIEAKLGSRFLLLTFFVTALMGNIIQALWQGPSLFGGLSGVVYGLLGYLWIWQLKVPTVQISLPPGILVFMLIWLLLGMTGTVELVFGTAIANGAHLGGLIAGMALGLLQTHWVLSRVKP